MRYLLPLLALLGCQAEPETAPRALIAKASDQDNPFAVSPVERVLGAVLDGPEPEVFAHVTVRHPKTACKVMGGGSIVQFSGRPLVGRPWKATWSTRPTTPPDQPDYTLVALLVSNHRVEGAPIPNGGGCWLLVRPDHVIAPGPILRERGGTYTLSMTWPRELLGTQWFMQLLLDDARVGSHVTTSPMLELTVGNR